MTLHRAALLAVPLLLGAILLLSPPAHAQWTWVAQSAGPRSEVPRAVETDAEGNMYVAGHFWGEATIAGTTLSNPSTTYSDGFLARYGPEGTGLWARSLSATQVLDVRALAIGAEGNVYVTGRFWGTATIGAFTLTAPAISVGDVFVAKYSPTGDVLWVAQVGGTVGPYAHHAGGIAVGPDGSIYLTGSFRETATLGPFSLVSAGGDDFFLAKLSSDGDFLWAQRGGGSGGDAGAGLAVDAGGVYVTGSFRSTATFGGTTLVSAGGADVFTARYTPAGALDWIRQGSGSRDSYGADVGLDAAGNAYVVGTFGQSVVFGGQPLTAPSNFDDGFLTVYDADGGVLWARRVGGGLDDAISGVAVDDAGRAYVAGSFTGTATFGGLTVTGYGGTEFFLATFSPGGDVAWVAPANGAAPSSGADVALHPAGDVVFAGSFVGDLFLSGIPLHNTSDPGQRDMVLARHAPAAVLAPVAVSAEPVGGTITIPATGGSFQFTVTLTNVTAEPQTFQAWTEVTGPASRSPVFGPQTVRLGPGASVTRTLTQQVPAAAPWGNYTYRVNVGAFPGNVTATAAFPFVKFQGAPAPRASGAAAPGTDAWAVSGWGDGPAAASALHSHGFALGEARPNPFTRQSALTLEVAAAQHVRAEVFDALGRRVAVLLDEATEAGAHALVFDGSALPAGVYVVRVTGETFSAARRLTLLR